MQIQFPINSVTFGSPLPPSQVKRPAGGAGSGLTVVYSEPSPQAGSSPNGIPHTKEELLAIVQQQQTQVSSFFDSLGQGQSVGIGSLASPGVGTLPNFADSTGGAIDYLLGSTGSGSGAGDVFNLALTVNSRGLELAQVQGALAAQAQSAYQDAATLVQLVQDAKQSNLDTLFQIGGGSGSAGISALI